EILEFDLEVLNLIPAASHSAANRPSFHPSCCRRQKLKSCTENHGIRPPPPEQYLTPLQQKEVCIRHLKSKLRETIDTLQNRDVEVDELRERLFRMQEDWVEEECHRVEAQLALKEARTEIQALKAAVEGVRARLGDTGDFQSKNRQNSFDVNFQNHRLEALLLNMEAAQGSVKEAEERAEFRTPVPRVVPSACAGSCSSSPARSIGRSSTYTKLTEADRGGHEFGSMSADGTRDSGFVCGGESGVPSRADLLLEAAYLSEETASLLSAYTQTFAALPTSELSVACRGGGASDLDTIAERTFRSQACSPTSTWASDEGEELDSTSLTTATVMSAATEPAPSLTRPEHQAVEGAQGGSAASEGGAEGRAVGGAEDPAPVQKSYWSRHFLVDLLAVAIPVVPTVAWLCRGPTRNAQPMYHFGSLLRGCCTVALTSLRRSGGLRHYPAGGGAHI
uniref:Syntaphilin b n=1 Tax=Neogobius melanostomus TaxID=47308 RepID=A0A8C6WHD7_9GOBI